MKKIPSVFQRNYETDRLIRDEVVPGCEWVLAGEGIATVKWDGTACMVRDFRLYKRYDVKQGRTPPPGWEACQEPDAVTGHHPGWVPVGGGPDERWHIEGFLGLQRSEPDPRDGTYELVGPKVQSNPYSLREHALFRHGSQTVHPKARTFEAFRQIMRQLAIEGIVFHHPDGRMAKVKARDYGLPWPRPAEKKESDGC